MDLVTQLDAALTALTRVLTLDARRVLADVSPAPLNQLDLETLSYIERNPGTLARDVATFLGVKPTTMQSALDRLYLRGLLQRDLSALKGRAVALTLTDAGVAFRQRLHTQNLKNCRDMLMCIDESERELLVANIAKIANTMSSEVT